MGKVKLKLIEFPGCSYSFLSSWAKLPSEAPGNIHSYHQAIQQPSGNHQSQSEKQSRLQFDFFRPNLIRKVYFAEFLQFMFVYTLPKYKQIRVCSIKITCCSPLSVQTQKVSHTVGKHVAVFFHVYNFVSVPVEQIIQVVCWVAQLCYEL